MFLRYLSSCPTPRCSRCSQRLLDRRLTQATGARWPRQTGPRIPSARELFVCAALLSWTPRVVETRQLHASRIERHPQWSGHQYFGTGIINDWNTIRQLRVHRWSREVSILGFRRAALSPYAAAARGFKR
jgi:hypothetical protein